jgi:gamma-glutamylcyclotransferase (GGCT)/AIG2-like uncharacterized protein YtfP
MGANEGVPGRDRPGHLFVYGTLLPGEVRWSLLEPYVIGGGTPDSAPGTLYDTGLDYPAAVFGGASLILGRTFAIEPDVHDDCLAHLDAVEGTVGGLYSRIVVTTTGAVEAWTYQYGGGLDLTPIPSGNWLHR